MQKKVSVLAAALGLFVTVDGLAQETLRFQEGVNGYEGTQDSYLQTGSPDQNNDFLNHNENKIWELEWDGSDASGRNLAMFWFPSMFGDGENQIPLGSEIVNANFQTMIINDGSRSDTSLVYRLTKEWDETMVTFNSYFDNVDAAAFGSADGSSAPGELQPGDPGQELLESTGYVATDSVVTALHIPNIAGGAFNLDLTPIAQEWSDGAENYGFVLMVVRGGNGFGHVSSEAQQITRQFIDDLVASGADVDGDIADPDFPGFDQNISPELVVQTPAGEFRFQDGERGYEGYQDATISNAGFGNDLVGINNVFDYPLGTEGFLSMDVSDDGSTNNFALVQFDNVIGEGENQIPPGTQIDNAFIRFFVMDDGPEIIVNEIADFEGTSLDGNPVSTDWDEETVTFANFVVDGFFPAFGQELTDEGNLGLFVPDSEFKFVEAEVTTTIQKYSNGEIPNRGWLFENPGGSDVSFVGKEGAQVFGAPALIVDYVPPEGSSVETWQAH